MALVILLLALWLVLGLWLIRRLGLERRWFWLCAGALVCALAVRFFCLDHQTSDYVDFFSHWIQFFRDNGGFLGLRRPIGDYNVPYLYFLAAISYLPVRDLYLIKLFSIFFDLPLALAALRLVRRLCPNRQGAWAGVFCAVLLLPTVTLNGAYWGQCDSIYAALTLLALADALEGRSARSVVWLGVAFSFKLQTIFLLPLWGALWYSGRVKRRHLCLFPLSYLATALPALLLGRSLGSILSVYVNQTQSYHDRLTLNAPSLYALIPYGAEVDGDFWARVGIGAAFALVLGLLVWLYLRRDRLDDAALLTAALVLAVGVPLLLPHMHERYFFLADVLAVVWCAADPRRLPVAAAVQTASLGGYHAYLVLRYAFPMSWGAWMMVFALAGAVWVLAGQLAAPGRGRGARPAAKAAKPPRGRKKRKG